MVDVFSFGIKFVAVIVCESPAEASPSNVLAATVKSFPGVSAVN